MQLFASCSLMLKQSRRGLKTWSLVTISNETRITPTCSNIWHRHNSKLVGDRTCTPFTAGRSCNRFWTLVELEPLRKSCRRPSMTWFCRWRGLRILVHSYLKSGLRKTMLLTVVSSETKSSFLIFPFLVSKFLILTDWLFHQLNVMILWE